MTTACEPLNRDIPVLMNGDDTNDVEMKNSAPNVSATWKINGFPHYWNEGHIKGVLEGLGLESVDVWTRKHNDNAFVRFKNSEEKLRAKSLLEGHTERKIKRLKCIDHPDRIKQKQNQMQSDKRKKAKQKRQRDDTKDGESPNKSEYSRGRKKKQPPSSIHDVVTPLYQMPYGEQIELKQKTILSHLRRFWRKLTKPQDPTNAEFLKWLHSGNPSRVFGPSNLKPGCPPFLGVLSSPLTESYRNSASFSIGYNKSTHLLTVGHQMGRFENGKISIEPVAECINIDAVSKRIAVCGETFVRQQFDKYQYDCFNKKSHDGIWRKLDVRTSSRCKQYVVFLEIQSKSLSTEQLDALKGDFVECMQIEGKAMKRDLDFELHGISMLINNTVSTANHNKCPFEVLYGDPFHFEIICGLKFRISSTAFFQVNTIAAERLYEVAAQWASDGVIGVKPSGFESDNRSNRKSDIRSKGKRIVLLDICCGTGTIGLCVAKQCGDTVRTLIGLELIEDAVQDARTNAKLNGFQNARFEAGKAEGTLERVLHEEVKEGDVVVAILDPPRCGVHKDICKLLRMQSKIQRIVYVSCNSSTLFGDATRLCQAPSKKTIGFPFKPIKSIGVDLFPHTEHVEMIMLFERCKEEDIDWDKVSLQAKEAHRKHLFHEEQKTLLKKQIDLLCSDIMEFMFSWKEMKANDRNTDIRRQIRRLFVIHETAPHSHKFMIDVSLPYNPCSV